MLYFGFYEKNKKKKWNGPVLDLTAKQSHVLSKKKKQHKTTKQKGNNEVNTAAAMHSNKIMYFVLKQKKIQKKNKIKKKNCKIRITSCMRFLLKYHSSCYFIIAVATFDVFDSHLFVVFCCCFL